MSSETVRLNVPISSLPPEMKVMVNCVVSASMRLTPPRRGIEVLIGWVMTVPPADKVKLANAEESEDVVIKKAEATDVVFIFG